MPERMNQSLNRSPYRLRRKWGPGREGIGIQLENRVFQIQGTLWPKAGSPDQRRSGIPPEDKDVS